MWLNEIRHKPILVRGTSFVAAVTSLGVPVIHVHVHAFFGLKIIHALCSCYRYRAFVDAHLVFSFKNPKQMKGCMEVLSPK